MVDKITDENMLRKHAKKKLVCITCEKISYLFEEQIFLSEIKVREEIKKFVISMHTIPSSKSVIKLIFNYVSILKRILDNDQLKNSYCLLSVLSDLEQYYNKILLNSNRAFCQICKEKSCFRCKNLDGSYNILETDVCRKSSQNSLDQNKLPADFLCCNHTFFKIESQSQSCSDCEILCCYDCILKCNYCDLKSCKKCIINEKSRFLNISIPKFNRDKSVLVGDSVGKVLDFDPDNMKVIKENYMENKIGNVNNILTLPHKYVIGIFTDAVTVWNDREFREKKCKINCCSSMDIKQFKDNLVAVANYNRPNKLILEDISANKTICDYTLSDHAITLCNVNDSSMLVGFMLGVVSVWNISNNSFTQVINNSSNYAINSIIKLRKNNEQFATGQGNNFIKLWTLEGNKKITEFTNKRKPQTIVKNNYWARMKELEDGRIVYFTDEYSISILDIKSNSNILMKSNSDIIIYDFFQLSNNLLLSCSWGKSIKKWDLRKHEAPCDEFNYTHPLFCFERE